MVASLINDKISRLILPLKSTGNHVLANELENSTDPNTVFHDILPP
jgi:hypothetical protein